MTIVLNRKKVHRTYVITAARSTKNNRSFSLGCLFTLSFNCHVPPTGLFNQNAVYPLWFHANQSIRILYINIAPKLCYKRNPKILYLLTTSCSKLDGSFLSYRRQTSNSATLFLSFTFVRFCSDLADLAYFFEII